MSASTRSCGEIGIQSGSAAFQTLAMSIAYLPVVYRFALEGDRERIANSLSAVTRERMELPPQRDRDLKVADLILAEKARIGVEANDA
jgi:hypothetical protein